MCVYRLCKQPVTYRMLQKWYKNTFYCRIFTFLQFTILIKFCLYNAFNSFTEIQIWISMSKPEPTVTSQNCLRQNEHFRGNRPKRDPSSEWYQCDCESLLIHNCTVQSLSMFAGSLVELFFKKLLVLTSNL